MGFDVGLTTVSNPRPEREEHYYNPKHQALLDLGLQPRFLTDDVVADLLERVRRHRQAIDTRCIMPRVRWVVGE
jgi:UDP-sulfoquinovose synthase